MLPGGFQKYSEGEIEAQALCKELQHEGFNKRSGLGLRLVPLWVIYVSAHLVWCSTYRAGLPGTHADQSPPGCPQPAGWMREVGTELLIIVLLWSFPIKRT